MANYLANVTLQKKDGSTVKGSEALSGKTVGLYFSAHWCPPCRQFTPILRDFYEELDGEGFEIVFVSFDRDQGSLMEYVNESHGDWYFLPFGSAEIQDLAKKYDVSGIPAFIIIKANGDVITKNARADVTGLSPKQALSQWKAAA